VYALPTHVFSYFFNIVHLFKWSRSLQIYAILNRATKQWFQICKQHLSYMCWQCIHTISMPRVAVVVWSPHINILKIEMGFSVNSSWIYDVSNLTKYFDLTIVWKLAKNKILPGQLPMQSVPTITNIAVIPKVRWTVTKVGLKLSWTDKIILIVGLIDQLTYARKYFICCLQIWNHCLVALFRIA
jgi:hypothetical protein